MNNTPRSEAEVDPSLLMQILRGEILTEKPVVVSDSDMVYIVDEWAKQVKNADSVFTRLCDLAILTGLKLRVNIKVNKKAAEKSFRKSAFDMAYLFASKKQRTRMLVATIVKS